MEVGVIERCDERYKRVDEVLGIHDDRLNDHSRRIKNMEINQVRTDTIVQNVCKQIGSLIRAIWWLIGIFITGSGGFILWFIKNLK